MDERTQEFLSEYVLNGGNLVLYPTVPQYNLYLNKCDILQSKLNLDFKTELSGNLIDFIDIEDVFTVFQQKTVFNKTGKHGIAFTDDNKICAISKSIGKGKLTVLGFTFGYTSDEHLEVYDRVIKNAGIKNNSLSKDKDLQITVRTGGKYRFIFVLNYHNEQKKFAYKKNNYIIKPYSYRVIKEKLS
jgi:beta-galactosidase